MIKYKVLFRRPIVALAALLVALSVVIHNPSWLHRLNPGGGTHDESSASLRVQPPTIVDADDGCNTEKHTDYGGPVAFVWGASFKVKDAGECCDACKAHANMCKSPDSEGSKFWTPSVAGDGVCGNHKHAGLRVTCNAWVFCPDHQCFSFDIHNHSRGECWLKFVEDPTLPSPWNGGDRAFPPEMRAAKRADWPWAVDVSLWPDAMPAKVSWTAGVLLPLTHVKPTHRDPEHRPDWWRLFMNKHGDGGGRATAERSS